MTVTYSYSASTSTLFSWVGLMFKWKGSLWKCVLLELLIWIVAYALLTIAYRLWMTDHQRSVFEDVCLYFETYSTLVPVTFVLGFYVTVVYNRWSQIFDNIGWIDNPGLMITHYIEGSSSKARLLRRNALRYIVLIQAMVFRDISARVKKRFPTLHHLVAAGLMTETELKHFEGVESPHRKYWLIAHWCFSNVRLAKKEGFISSDILFADLMTVLRTFRTSVIKLTLFDWVPVPLVYTQVVHLAVRSYFAIALLGRQHLKFREPKSAKEYADIYFPIIAVLQFIFTVGWLKVAEVILNPMGEDDDDFEVNYILDRNLQVGLQMVDQESQNYPPLEKDFFWNDVAEPYYTRRTAQLQSNPQIGSVAHLEPSPTDCIMLRKKSILKNGTEKDQCDSRMVNGMTRQRKVSKAESVQIAVIERSRKISSAIKKLGKRPSSTGIIKSPSDATVSSGTKSPAENGSLHRKISIDLGRPLQPISPMQTNRVQWTIEESSEEDSTKDMKVDFSPA